MASNSGKNVNNDSDVLTRDNKQINWKKEVIGWISLIIAAFILAYVITHFIIIKSEIPTGSMEKTIMTNDKIVGNRLAYLFDEPERGDIIIFQFPDNEKETYIKRVIGLPGEKVNIIDGSVYINDSNTPLDEPYLWEKMNGSYGPYEVPADCYFCLGDNRNISIDARRWTNKFVSKDKIYAKAWFRYSPSIGLIK